MYWLTFSRNHQKFESFFHHSKRALHDQRTSLALVWHVWPWSRARLITSKSRLFHTEVMILFKPITVVAACFNNSHGKFHSHGNPLVRYKDCNPSSPLSELILQILTSAILRYLLRRELSHGGIPRFQWKAQEKGGNIFRRNRAKDILDVVLTIKFGTVFHKLHLRHPARTHGSYEHHTFGMSFLGICLTL